jgi:hypothetical protein
MIKILNQLLDIKIYKTKILSKSKILRMKQIQLYIFSINLENIKKIN